MTTSEENAHSIIVEILREEGVAYPVSVATRIVHSLAEVELLPED